MILVIGIGGLIGKNLFPYLAARYEGVIATSHQKNLSDALSVYFLDLENPDFAFLSSVHKRIQYAVICSGQTNIDKCKIIPIKSKVINLTGITQLVKQLFKYEIIPVFLSSDAVFDGQSGNYSEEAECHPTTIYGEQKLAIENYLKFSKSESVIIRLTKVFDVNFQGRTLITSWLDSLLAEEEILCASDQFISPTYVADVCRAIELLIKNKRGGVYHVCSPITLSRYDLGLKVSNYFGFKKERVRKCSILDFKFSEPRSSYSTLSVKKIQEEYNFTATPFEKSLELIKLNYKPKLR